MHLQLVALEGPYRGSVWQLGPEGLVLGRGLGADVPLRDPLASRRHCKLSHAQDGAVVEDLGARNLALVEGKAVRRATLRIGETLSIGSECFLLAGAPVETTPAPDNALARTASLTRYVTMEMPGNRSICLGRGPATVEKLTQLYETIARMAVCDDLKHLIRAARTCLTDQFHPRHIWLTIGNDEYTSGAQPESAGEALPATVASAMGNPEPLLLPSADNQRGTFILTPLRARNVVLGHVILESGEVPYRESDLPMLELFATVLTPFLLSLEVCDRLEREQTQA